MTASEKIYTLLIFLQVALVHIPVMPSKPANLSSTSAANIPNVSANISRYPCGTCDRSVKWNQRGVACESCGQWFHLGCQDLELDTEEYEKLGESDISWRCVICDNANYSTTAFDLHGLSNVHQEFSQSSNCTMNSNLDGSFHPLHASTPTRSSKQDKHTRRPLRFLTLNCRSIIGKTIDFENLTQSVKPDVILGTESWLNLKISNAEIFPKGYTIYRKDRPDTVNGGGIFIAVSDELTTSEEPELSTDCEILWIKIKLKGRRTLLVSCFYHPHTGYKESMENFLSSIRRASTHENAIIVIGGDFNLPGFDWRAKTLKKTNHPTIHRDFRDGINELGFEQMVEEPTRDENFLDLFLTNNPNLVQRTETLPGLSDHDAVYMEVQIHPPKRRQPKRRIPLYTEECIGPLREAVTELSENIIENHSLESNVETVWNELKDGLLQACEDHVRHKITKSKSSLPWVEYDTKK